jgi:response regulator RpfG family c-di-GMP phosphodiesterase
MAKTILAVDDSASIRQMVSFTLKSAGYDVVEAVDGMDGLEKAKARSVNLVLTDQNMPRMDGLTLIKTLRTLPQYRSTPILMLTLMIGRRGGRRKSTWRLKPSRAASSTPARWRVSSGLRGRAWTALGCGR